ncbi:hypothetical protein MUU72_08120 [Streptomyces sp. RS10V-4]|uniref:hypothetical protein n=1 Tax=Streptomyces rhizoryzae TaxID=2932493 RepID=UPI0020066C08|nr:hypothetical protein [Streptomyces rhizoryzae]MCK7623064.1 hypothetical protein [Streptomyces rhizoryzae]
MNPMDTARLLPWTGPDGKPCYLLGGTGTGTGYVSRLADRTCTPGELHLLAVELNTLLINIHRVSASRGARLLLLDSTAGADDDPAGEGTRKSRPGRSPRYLLN